ncbi:MAG: hypothetical protein RIK87_30840 [Fuerstiella sp.]
MPLSTTYRQLDAEKTISTLETLRNRISERFADSSLAQVAEELCEMSRESKSKIEWIDRPHLGLRAAVIAVVLASLGLLAFGVTSLLNARAEAFGVADTISVLEAATNEVIVAGAALLFLFSLELRIKRTRALRTLHDLRAIAHVIDMHQLTKDPSQMLTGSAPTKSSPRRVLTPYQLTRYLDYCSELLSLIGKLAALYAQSLPDQIVVGAVNDIETLTNGLSRKIWQKIVMLEGTDRLAAASASEPGTAGHPGTSQSTDAGTSSADRG